jgi:serine/threonine protein kinase
METFNKIKAAGLSPDLRIARLYGLIKKKDIVFGLLTTYVPCEGKHLGFAMMEDPSNELRKRWAGQIKATLDALHQADIIWGNARPENILIDTDNNAWIVDIGGTDVAKWMEIDKPTTAEDDLKGLTEILKYIAKYDSTRNGTIHPGLGQVYLSHASPMTNWTNSNKPKI